MRLSHFALIVVLAVSSRLLAQHHPESGGSSSGGGSMSSSSTSSSSSSSSGSSSGSSASSSSSHSSSDHSSSSSSDSSSSRSSDASSSSGSHSSASHSSSEGGRASHSGAEGTRPDRGRDVSNSDTSHESKKSQSSDGRAIPKKEVGEQPSTDAKREKKNFLLFWKHPGKKAEPKTTLTAKARPPHRCKQGEKCPVCGAGETSNKGKCVPQPTVASNECPPGEHLYGGRCMIVARCENGTSWDGVRCEARGNSCGEAAILANELRGTQAQMRTACSASASSQECAVLRQQHEGTLSRYRMLWDGASPSCRATLPDPSSM